jgi:hypothetical protein
LSSGGKTGHNYPSHSQPIPFTSSEQAKRNALADFRELALTNKKTGEVEKYKIYREVDLTFLGKACKKGNGQTLLDFNMKKLELEYDYDTDEDQLNAAKSMLLRENLDAIQFYVKDGDPLLLVDNLQYLGPTYQNNDQVSSKR